MQIAFLVGNSSLKFAGVEADSLVAPGAVDWSTFARRGLAAVRTGGGDEPPTSVWVASVRDDLRRRLEVVLPPSWPRPLVARADFPIPIASAYDRPEEAGTDRLLNALAARRRCPGEPVVVADCGTALSVTVVSSDGVFVGGAIGVGVGAALAGLRQATPRLPVVERGPPSRWLARSTREAIRAGVVAQLSGGIRRLLEGFEEELGARPRLLLTGGDAELVAPDFPEAMGVFPWLGLEGLVLAARGEG